MLFGAYRAPGLVPNVVSNGAPITAYSPSFISSLDFISALINVEIPENDG